MSIKGSGGFVKRTKVGAKSRLRRELRFDSGTTALTDNKLLHYQNTLILHINNCETRKNMFE